MVVRASLLGDGATNGATITTANSGRKAGIAVDLTTIGTGCALTWDTGKAFLGTAAMHVVTTSGQNCYGRWANMFRPSGPDLVASVWFYFTANPTASTSLIFVGDDSAARACEMRVTSTGKVQAYDQAATAQAATTTSITLNQWVRADLYFTPHASAGKLQIKLYNTPSSSTPTETTAQATGLALRTATPSTWILGTANGSAAAQSYWMQAVLSDGAAAPFGRGWVQSRWVGAATPTTVQVATRVMAASSVRLKVSTTSDLATAPVSSGSTAPDADGTVRLSVSGLTPDTAYFYGLEVDGTIDTEFNGTFRTFPAAGSFASFGFAAASCARNNSNSAAFDAIRARTGADGKTALFFQHLGDLHYFADDTHVAADFHTHYDRVMSSPKQNDFFGKIGAVYTWSDHDSGSSNHDGTSASLPYAQAVYRSRVPAYTLPDANGIYHSYTVGRIKVIVTDGRSFMSPIAATDDASKTKLGSTQKAWLKAQLSDPNYPVKLWMHEDAWNTGATFGGDDQWSAYSTERTELAAYITSNGIRVAYVHGDLHTLAADDGSHAAGGFPQFCASPLDNSAFIGNGTWTNGPIPAANSTPPTYYLQYGWFDVADTGTQIAVTFKGFDSAGTQQLTRTASWTIPAATASPTQIATDGTTPVFRQANVGDKVLGGDGVYVTVRNASAATVTLTINPPGSTSYGVAKPAKVVSVAASGEKDIPMHPEYAAADGTVTLVWSATPQITWAARRMAT